MKTVPNKVKKWRRTTTATSTTTANKKMNLLVFSSKMSVRSRKMRRQLMLVNQSVSLSVVLAVDN